MDVDVDSVEAELNAYTRVQQVPLDTDPLMWWKQDVQEFPHLVLMVRQYLTVPATSTSPERLCRVSLQATVTYPSSTARELQ